MAGAAPTSDKGGRRKPIDAALNLVPFIDLLSCCIAFLLITAVWTQLSAVPAGIGGGRSPGPAPVDPLARLELQVDVGGYTLTASDAPDRVIPHKNGAWDDAALAVALRDARSSHPLLDSIAIAPADRIPYERFVRAMDLARAQFPAIRVAD